MMLPISAHILLAKGHREDQSYHVSKKELKVFGDGMNYSDCRQLEE